jgi:gluconolactonase
VSGDYEVVDRRFRAYLLGNCRVERLYTGTLWGEGPVYFRDGDFLVWSDIPNDRLLRWVPGLGVEEFRHPSGYANGHTRDRQGRLVSCEHGGRRVTRTEWDGSLTVLADRYRGRRLNSPNDVVVKSDGSVWFTDPPYGILSDYEGQRAPSELDACYLFRLDPGTGELEVAADDLEQPNGLAFSPDESRLYVSDTGAGRDAGEPNPIYAYDVVDGRRLTRRRLFAVVSPRAADGLRLDEDGNVWTSAGDGVHCLSPGGDLLGKIRIPEKVANLTFGGPKRNRLFVVATTSLYAVFLNRRGAERP